jgi:hypothetical protein
MRTTTHGGCAQAAASPAASVPPVSERSSSDPSAALACTPYQASGGGPAMWGHAGMVGCAKAILKDLEAQVRCRGWAAWVSPAQTSAHAHTAQPVPCALNCIELPCALLRSPCRVHCSAAASQERLLACTSRGPLPVRRGARCAGRPGRGAGRVARSGPRAAGAAHAPAIRARALLGGAAAGRLRGLAAGGHG